jgi:hypothetical protein
MKIKKVIVGIKCLVVIVLLLPLVSSSYTIPAMAALPEQKEDVMKNSPEHDGKGLDACGTTSKKESSGIGDPGKLFILGDSLG